VARRERLALAAAGGLNVALHGTIRDFALPDIFQLIGIQRKTGVLTLDNGENSVTLKFLDGQVVGADTKTETLEERLGELLVRTGRITEAQLREALVIQQNTLQRLGHILVQQGILSQDDLVEALRVQSSQIIYRLFRWREGTYHFDRVDDLDYDQAHFTPISSETILMEGARMIDEWPIIERRIRSDRMVLRKTESARALSLEPDSLLKDDADFELGPAVGDEGAGGQGNPITLSREERQVLACVDGRRTVRAICDLVTLSEFDTHRILSDMMTRSLVEDAGAERIAPARPQGRSEILLAWGAHALVVLLASAALLTLPLNPLTPWRLLAGTAATDQLRHYASMARLEKIESAIEVFYLDAGTVPDPLEVLARAGYLRADELTDPWGRPYRLEVSSGGYVLQGGDARGEATPELTVSRRFNAVQRMMLQDAGAQQP
jgi:hypothetical protein